MSPRFLTFFEWLMRWEGEVYENDPDDPGGATKYGIDQRSHPEVNIRRLTRDQAQAIYVSDYWVPIRGQELPAPLDWVMADIAVNNGRTRAVKWLQEELNTVADGIFGKVTLAAVRKHDEKDLARALLNRREAFYRQIATGRKRKFLKGWLNRNNDLRAVTKL
jgi:lysozyme family protein